MTGPNIAPMLAVPRYCTRNTPIRMSTVNGTTYGSNAVVAVFKPSTAPSTVMAGVITPSP